MIFHSVVTGADMIVKILGSSVIGIEAYLIEVEVYTAPGLPQFSTVGLPDVAVRESRERIKAAVKSSGYPFPRHHVTVNLAPADIRKEGTGFDLPMAAGILAAEGVVRPELLGQYVLIGELSLDGRIKGVQGALPAAMQARELGLRGILLAPDNAPEAALVNGIEVIPVAVLTEVVEFLNGGREIAPWQRDAPSAVPVSGEDDCDFRDVQGQDQAKRALEIAAAGFHNLLMLGPPGSGKTMLARRLPSILPPLSFAEAVEAAKIYSVAGLLSRGDAVMRRRPFRAPHHTISDAGLIGGGLNPRPGEISLAHHGVLFLDELPEFRKNALEALRQPLEEGRVTIARAAMTVAYPSHFLLVAAMNPCPCGYYGDIRRSCRCSAQQIRQYQRRLSGPLLDRIDLHIEVPSLRYRELTGRYQGETSAAIRERIGRARAVQEGRFGTKTAPFNARMSDGEIKRHCRVDGDSQQLLEMAMEKLGLSARAYKRILKVARTIADLDGRESLQASHVAEAIQYRNLDRKLIW